MLGTVTKEGATLGDTAGGTAVADDGAAGTELATTGTVAAGVDTTAGAEDSADGTSGAGTPVAVVPGTDAGTVAVSHGVLGPSGAGPLTAG